VVAVRLLARGVGALRGTLTGEGDFERRRTGLGFGDLVERAGIAESRLHDEVREECEEGAKPADSCESIWKSHLSV